MVLFSVDLLKAKCTGTFDPERILHEFARDVDKALCQGIVRARVNGLDGEFIVRDVRILEEVIHADDVISTSSVRLQVELLEGWKTPLLVFDDSEVEPQEVETEQ